MQFISTGLRLSGFYFSFIALLQGKASVADVLCPAQTVRYSGYMKTCHCQSSAGRHNWRTSMTILSHQQECWCCFTRTVARCCEVSTQEVVRFNKQHSYITGSETIKAFISRVSISGKSVCLLIIGYFIITSIGSIFSIHRL